MTIMDTIYTVYRHYEGGPAKLKRGRLPEAGNVAAGFVREGEYESVDEALAVCRAINATVPPPKPLGYFPTRTLETIEQAAAAATANAIIEAAQGESK